METPEKMGFKRGGASACCFYHEEMGVKCVAQGDGFAFTEYDVGLDWAQREMRAHSTRKDKGRLGGGPADLKEVRLLNRVIRWTPMASGVRQARATRNSSRARRGPTRP